MVTGFESWKENFLLHGQLPVLTHISVPFHLHSMEKILVILPKVQVAGYS